MLLRLASHWPRWKLNMMSKVSVNFLFSKATPKSNGLLVVSSLTTDVSCWGCLATRDIVLHVDLFFEAYRWQNGTGNMLKFELWNEQRGKGSCVTFMQHVDNGKVNGLKWRTRKILSFTNCETGYHGYTCQHRGDLQSKWCSLLTLARQFSSADLLQLSSVDWITELYQAGIARRCVWIHRTVSLDLRTRFSVKTVSTGKTLPEAGCGQHLLLWMNSSDRVTSCRTGEPLWLQRSIVLGGVPRLRMASRLSQMISKPVGSRTWIIGRREANWSRVSVSCAFGDFDLLDDCIYWYLHVRVSAVHCNSHKLKGQTAISHAVSYVKNMTKDVYNYREGFSVSGYWTSLCCCVTLLCGSSRRLTFGIDRCTWPSLHF